MKGISLEYRRHHKSSGVNLFPLIFETNNSRNAWILQNISQPAFYLLHHKSVALSLTQGIGKFFKCVQSPNPCRQKLKGFPERRQNITINTTPPAP